MHAILPGVTYMKERLNEIFKEIDEYWDKRERELRGKINPKKVIPEKKKFNTWSNYTPEQKAARVKKARLGQLRAKKLRAKKLREANK